MSASKGGRPREGSAPKLAPLNMRTSPQIREKIEQAADVIAVDFDRAAHSAEVAVGPSEETCEEILLGLWPPREDVDPAEIANLTNARAHSGLR